MLGTRLRLPYLLVLVAACLPLLTACCTGCKGSRSAASVASTSLDSQAEAGETTLASGTAEPESAPGPFITTDTGLKYRTLRKATGRHPLEDDTVVVHYHGWLDDGTVFDSSYERNKPATFPLKGVVPGFREGLLHVGEGGMVEIEVPGRLGYGYAGSPPKIPPNATLHFRVELLAIR